jgi:hypothetical protein
MELLITAAVIIGVMLLLALLGVVRSIVRLIAAVVMGLLAPAALYVIVTMVTPSLFGVGFEVSTTVYVVIGALSALNVLLRR